MNSFEEFILKGEARQKVIINYADISAIQALILKVLFIEQRDNYLVHTNYEHFCKKYNIYKIDKDYREKN